MGKSRGGKVVGYLDRKCGISAEATYWTVKEHKRVRREKRWSTEMETVEQIACTLHAEREECLSNKEDNKGIKVACIGKLDIMSTEDPYAKDAWVFERFYDAKNPSDEAVSIR